MKKPCEILGHYWISVAQRDDGLIAQSCMRCTAGRIIDPKKREKLCQPSEASPAMSAG